MKAKTAVAVWLSVAGLCLAAAGTVRGASGTLPAPPAGWGDCDVLDYVAEGGGPAARGAADAGGTVERWLVRNAAAGTRYALERRPRGGRDMSVCAYSPNRVLATLRPDSSYAAFAAELAAKGMRIVRLLMEDLDGNPVYLIEAEDAETDVVGQMTMGIEETGMCGRISPDRIYEAGAVPNDTDYGRQWGLAKIGAERAWETRTDASGTVLAVLDTGVNFDHYDLNRNLWTNPGEVPGDGVDNDGNGIVDDVYGVACLGGNLSGNPMDDHGHGSHCAGIAGAAGNNRRGGTGVAWTARIMGLKFLNADGRGATSDAITCLRYAEDHGVRVVNCSFGSSDWDDYLYEQMKKMAAKGVLFACAAGNARNGEKPRDNDEYPFYPANFPVENLVAVAASGEDDRLAGFSHYGATNVDLAAPGVDIYSTTLGTYGMDHKSGTSMATPFVAGALALLWSEWPEETAGRIADRLYAAAEPVAALEGKVRTGARLSMEGFFGLPAPKEVSATQGTVADAVVLYWTAVPGATHYRAWRADSEDGEKTPLGDWRQGLTWSDTEPGPGETKWYFLQAAQSADGAKASSFSAGVPGFRPVPDETKVTVSFDAAGGTAERERQLYTIGEAYGSFPGAEWAGKVFLGWHTAAEGGTRVDETSVADAATTALHAHWIDGDALRVERLSARQRYPWNGLVDVTFELAGVPEGELASVSMEGVWTGADGEEHVAAAQPLATWVAETPEGLENGAHHAVWNAEADLGAGGMGELALRADLAVDVPPAPAAGTATDNPEAGAIDLEWSAARGASRYVVSRGTTDDRAAAEEAATVVGTAWRDDGVAAGALMHYWVQSGSSGGTSADALHLPAQRGPEPASEVEVTFDANGGQVSPASRTYEIGGTYGELPIPTRPGYDFAGWWTEATDGSRRVSGSTVTAGVTNLHAHWTFIDWTIDANGVLTGATLNGAVVADIPSSVTGIGEWAFYYNNELGNLIRVTIPDGVTRIEKWAFSGCSGLTNIAIPRAVTHIGDWAFLRCSSLRGIDIPSGVTNIGAYAFSECKSLASVSLPPGLTQLSQAVFSACTNLTTITLPDTLENIGDSAFARSGLTAVTIPAAVTNIGEYAFAGCAGLTAITVPQNVLSIGGAAFSDCPNLEAISVDPANRQFVSSGGVLYNAGKTVLLACPGKAATVTIPASVAEIGMGAFRGCTNLPTVTIPTSVTNIAEDAFAYCTGLVRMTVPGSVKELGRWAFNGCDNLSRVTISSGLERIGYGAFCFCSSLEMIAIPGSVTDVGREAFNGCTRLASITLPNSVTNVGSATFDGCTALTNAVLSSGMKSIPNSMFYGCYNLSAVTIPVGIKHIGDLAFTFCRNLSAVSLPSGLLTIGSVSFSDCWSLSSAELPATVVNIEQQAFEKCHGLTDINIPASVTNLDSRAYDSCSNLVSFTVNSGNAHYASSDGLVYSKDKKNLLICPPGKTSVAVLATATNIASYAFSTCRNLSDVDIPSGIVAIGRGAFLSCGSLESIDIPSTVTSLGQGMFNGCGKLMKVTIRGALENYNLPSFYNATQSTLTTYVTPNWTGPTDMWCGRPVVVQ